VSLPTHFPNASSRPTSRRLWIRCRRSFGNTSRTSSWASRTSRPTRTTRTDTPDEDELSQDLPVPFFRGTSVTSPPDAIFRGPILRCFDSRGDAVRAIRDTVVHEVGHMLGLEDEEMPY
jgi:hypothetical protein